MAFDPLEAARAAGINLTTERPAGGSGAYTINGQTFYTGGQQQVAGGTGLNGADQALLAILADPNMNDTAKQQALSQYQSGSFAGYNTTRQSGEDPFAYGARRAGADPLSPAANGDPTNPPAGSATGPSVDPAVQRSRSDAFATVSQLLAEYGLESLSGTVQQWAQQDLSPSEIALKIRDTPQFRDEYGGVLEARKKSGLPAVSVSDILGYRKHAAELFQAAGLPKGFHDDKSDYDKFIAGDVSLSELSDRINLAAQAAYKAPQEVRDALTQWGMGPGDLTAFWLNPDAAQPLLERKFAAAQLAGASTRTGFGSLDEQQATDLAQLGVTQDQAQQGFGNLVQSKELFGALDNGEDTINRSDQIGATFTGNALAQQRIATRAQRRKAAFEESGGFASSGKGIVGLGGAQ